MPYSILPRLIHICQTLIKFLDIRSTDVFLDIGHGIGNTCIQAAFTTGCDSKGIEVVQSRHDVAIAYRSKMLSIATRKVGNIDLRKGRLEEKSNFEFLTKNVSKTFANNFGYIFHAKAGKANQRFFLDDFVAAIFAHMKPGCKMATMQPLTFVTLPREAENRKRRQQGLMESKQASFYDLEVKNLGKHGENVKWSQFSGSTRDIPLYIYTRLEQGVKSSEPVILCSNPACDFARRMEPIPATTKIFQDGEEHHVVHGCECKVSPTILRERKPVDYRR